jgi:hypothetical protein
MPNHLPTTLSRSVFILAAGLLALGVAGCDPGHRPGGSQTSMDEFTYESTPDTPKTIRVLDLGTNSVLWTIQVPVGQQVVIRFNENPKSTDPNRPDLMWWELMEMGNEHRQLHNSMPAPPSYLRRIDVELRKNATAVPAPEMAQGKP